MPTFTYTVVLERNESGGYTVTVPALKGCVTQGETIAQALDRAKEAIECHLEALASLGKRIPSDAKAVRLNVAQSDEILVFKVRVSPEIVEAKVKAKVE
ncbi:MAG: type II toxin-antitoxin system HicB family antitoxin [Armatimonadetes bacterium]|nr:type II toxin-antitoxin system HicB family antitoxin [Armatimonadota bacterium]